MKEDKIAMHTRAVNLARRFTEQNENDLMMVSVRCFVDLVVDCVLSFRRRVFSLDFVVSLLSTLQQ